MGVHYSFLGHVTINPPLNAVERDHLAAFSDSRRWDRPSGPYTVPDHPLVDDYEVEGVTGDASSLGLDWPGNRPPRGQPNQHCAWSPCPKGCCLAHDGTEKFSDAPEWMAYLIDHFLRPGAVASTDTSGHFDGFTFDHRCDGVVAEERRDVRRLSLLRVVDNEVHVEVLVPGEGSPW